MTLPAPRRSAYRSYRSTFYIFPAMIPLIELLPWLLGLVGGAAGLTEFVREKIRRQPRHAALVAIAIILPLTGGGLYLWHQSRLPAHDTSVVVAAHDFSKVIAYPTAAGQALPAPENFGVLWQGRSKTQLMGTPVIAGDVILTGTLHNTLEARRRSDGALLWTLQKREPVFTSAFVLGDMGVIGEGLHTAPSATLTGFKLATGQPVWERTFRSHIETSPAYDQQSNTIFQPAGAEGIWALDPGTGEVKWHSAIGHIDVTPLFHDGRLFVPAKLTEDDADGSALFELDPDTGEIISQAKIPGNPMGDILLARDGRMAFTTAIGQVGLNKDTDRGWLHVADMGGRILWTQELAAMPLPEGQIWPEKDTVYLALKNSSVVAVNIATRQIAWSVAYGGEFKSDLLLVETLAQPLIVAVTGDGFVGIRNALDGTPVTSLKLEGGTYSSPVAADGVLYLSAPYSMYAYGPLSALEKK